MEITVSPNCEPPEAARQTSFPGPQEIPPWTMHMREICSWEQDWERSQGSAGRLQDFHELTRKDVIWGSAEGDYSFGEGWIPVFVIDYAIM